jgi:hypothetical protein
LEQANTTSKNINWCGGWDVNTCSKKNLVLHCGRQKNWVEDIENIVSIDMDPKTYTPYATTV